ncbi:unnamed protein product [Nezara viridula]|uniref:EF-hand domain-containing protein n=1 Tax=Nezara viridula TaxID=85310 RepID=A0A9P0HP48_NEZVI|nr:unnamed protein product [Nezara viridula]
MEATTDYKNMIKDLFQALEPEGRGKVHKDNLKKNMKQILSGKMLTDEAIDKMIEVMSPDKDGMISIKNYLKLFSMPEFSAEEAAATRTVLKKWPQLLDGLMDSKRMAAMIGYDNPKKVEKIVSQLKDCYLENLDRRLKKEPPKSKKVVREKQAQLLRAIGEKIGVEDIGGMKEESQ